MDAKPKDQARGNNKKRNTKPLQKLEQNLKHILVV